MGTVPKIYADMGEDYEIKSNCNGVWWGQSP